MIDVVDARSASSVSLLTVHYGHAVILREHSYSNGCFDFIHLYNCHLLLTGQQNYCMQHDVVFKIPGQSFL